MGLLQLKMGPRAPVSLGTGACFPVLASRTRVIVLARGFELAISIVVHEGLAKITFSSAFCGSV